MQTRDQIVIVYYPICGGGKFVINSLGLSRYCTLHDYELAVWDSAQTVHDEFYYQTKLKHTLATVPENKNNVDWSKYEMGNSHYTSSQIEFENNAVAISKQNQYFCLTAHTPDHLKNIINLSKSNKIIKLTNYSAWLKISAFKHQSITNDIENKINYWNYIDQQEVKEQDWWFTINVDAGINNQSVRQKQIEDLYQMLGWDDFNQEIWSQYYQKYMQSHKIF
jgi:hypothetical protein